MLLITGVPPRFSPGKDWPVNTNLQPALDLLAPLQAELGPALSWSDLIVLAGTTALETAADINIPFCPVGRAEAEDGEGWRFLEPRVSGKTNETVELLKDHIAVSGLTNRQFAALLGAGYSLGQSTRCDGFFCQRNSFLATTTNSPSTQLSNVFFNDLLNNQWREHQVGDRLMYKVRSHLFLTFFYCGFIFSSGCGGRFTDVQS